jgi:hypothetical protein
MLKLMMHPGLRYGLRKIYAQKVFLRGDVYSTHIAIFNGVIKFYNYVEVKNGGSLVLWL